MSNPIIEIPEEVKATAQRVRDGREFHMATTVALAEFILGLNKPEIEAEPFVIYKVQVGGGDNPRIGFRVKKDVPYPWVILHMESAEKDTAYPVSAYNQIHKDEDIRVLERWTPEAPELEFGIGESGDYVYPDQKVLVKGVTRSGAVDSDGDVRVEMDFADGIAAAHYVAATDIAYAEEAK